AVHHTVREARWGTKTIGIGRRRQVSLLIKHGLSCLPSRRECHMRAAARAGHLASILLFTGSVGLGMAEERTQGFDRDPGWEGHNNRPATPAPRQVRQDFGYSNTSHAGGKPGEMGGFITPAAEPAYYAKKLPTKTFADALSASGTLACTGRPFHALI